MFKIFKKKSRQDFAEILDDSNKKISYVIYKFNCNT